MKERIDTEDIIQIIPPGIWSAVYLDDDEDLTPYMVPLIAWALVRTTEFFSDEDDPLNFKDLEPIDLPTHDVDGLICDDFGDVYRCQEGAVVCFVAAPGGLDDVAEAIEREQRRRKEREKGNHAGT